MLAIRSIGIRSTARVVPRLLVARPFTTVKSDATENAEDAILKAQRLNRPTSPHLEIYKFELPMIMSSFHRITGVVLAGTFYGITCTYALSSLLGVADYSAALASTFAALPFVAKLAAKGILAFPFAFHAFNGIRHLIWDAGKELTIKGVYRTGYVVTGLSLVVGAYLTFI
ncbi:unnamed protein product [Kuraishia capsulata CBS 1993]|uniref:Succinate dehydrogenase cytochrome b560 subunit n=1 Tax=Kuraishia capsulata CBS 1993 TaxID=1382522 RepID=W6MS75_9ASCO|nr:uncharacterized protein KUCA_T00000636001 [Kuraishia capsulata CBS 1993]CDK24670.1 unnamed protein product [Kuraishia capsulata CBS 1993]